MSNNIERIKKYIYSILSKEEFRTIKRYYKELREKRAEYDDVNELSFFFSFALVKDLFENYEVKQMIKDQKELEYGGVLEYLFLKLFKFLDIDIGFELYYDIIIKVHYLVTFKTIKDEKMLLYYLNQLYYNEETYSRNQIKYIHDSKIAQIINYVNNQVVQIGELEDSDLRLKDIFESIEKLATRKLMKVSIEESVIKKYFEWLINSKEIDLEKKVVRFEKYQGDKYTYDIPLKYDDDIIYEDYISKYSKDEYIHDISKTADKKVMNLNSENMLLSEYECELLQKYEREVPFKQGNALFGERENKEKRFEDLNIEELISRL